MEHIPGTIHHLEYVSLRLIVERDRSFKAKTLIPEREGGTATNILSTHVSALITDEDT
jgi:hypothetical protein